MSVLRTKTLALLATALVLPAQASMVSCDLNMGSCSQGPLTVSMTPSQPVAEQPVTFTISSSAKAVPTLVRVSGVSMYMGDVPMLLKKHGNQWTGQVTLARCVHNAMVWGFELNGQHYTFTIVNSPSTEHDEQQSHNHEEMGK